MTGQFIGASMDAVYTEFMVNQRKRTVFMALGALALVWVVAMAGYVLAQHAKITVEKVRAYAESVDLSKLSGRERAEAIDKLAAMLNALSLDERQKERRGDRTGERWFQQMTEEEKNHFVEATMPTGMKQMIQAFEQLPEDQRKRAVDRAMKRWSEDQGQRGDGSQPPISDELRQKIIRIGLQQFYSQSSAETKAEVAPLLEQIQKVMENGQFNRGGR
jgi:hypothetical protein